MRTRALVRDRLLGNGDINTDSTKTKILKATTSPPHDSDNIVTSNVATKPQTKRGKSSPKLPAPKKKQKSAVASEVRKAEEGETVDLSDSIFTGEDNEDDEVGQCEAPVVIESRQLKIECNPVKPSRRAISSSFVKSSRIPSHVATRDFPHRYPNKSTTKSGITEESGRKKNERGDIETEPQVRVTAHYKQAEVDGQVYLLGDCVHVNNDTGHDYLASITEFFEKDDDSQWLAVKWFFRAEETAMGNEGKDHDKRRVFYSEEKDDNLLECIIEKKRVVRVPSLTRFNKGPRVIPPCDYYFDKGYKYAYSTFYELPEVLGDAVWMNRTSSDVSTVESDDGSAPIPVSKSSVQSCPKPKLVWKASTANDRREELKSELQLLDLYCGCGAMSTGLCLGANLAGANLVTRWAVDLNEYACISIKHNHPETKVRKEAAEDFLSLLKEWKNLCDKYPEPADYEPEKSQENDDDDGDSPLPEGEYAVDRLIGIRLVGNVDNKGRVIRSKEEDDKSACSDKLTSHRGIVKHEDQPFNKGIEYKVKWKGYSDEHNTWEPAASMVGCPELVQQFVLEGRRCKILPLRGDVDVICGGPPCQGASGFNRFRNSVEPLEDPRNKQIVVYMDIVDFLRPRFILMENVVDILKFCGGILGRYALARAVCMNYQAKIGLMVAGCYGLPQFRMRCFLYGACSDEMLPPFPLPTHSVIVRGGVPNQWERCLVAYNESHAPEWLQRPLVLKDAISDLPPVDNFQEKDDITYKDGPRTSFQRFVRLPKQGSGGLGGPPSKKQKVILTDHQPLCLNTDDYMRVCQIPKRKGANFRDLKGILTKEDGITVDVVREPRELLPSGKPLVPDYAVTYMKGRSQKPFGRLWWDETVPTVITRAEPHNQTILHPVQDRVLSIRENARLQGFPDYYKLFGSVKERYMQVGNAVAVPVATALGYSLGRCILRKTSPEDETIELPRHFPHSLTIPEGVPDLPDNEED